MFSSPESCLSSLLLSVSIKASVRSYWLISAVSAGGHGGRGAGLSDSFTDHRIITRKMANNKGTKLHKKKTTEY